jgi:hypothetical protein
VRTDLGHPRHLGHRTLPLPSIAAAAYRAVATPRAFAITAVQVHPLWVVLLLDAHKVACAKLTAALAG